LTTVIASEARQSNLQYSDKKIMIENHIIRRRVMKHFFNVMVLVTLLGMLSQIYGQWSKHVIDPSISNPAIVKVGDIDGDGDLDAAATSFSGDKVYWYRNNAPDLTWTEYTIENNLDGAVGVEIVDVDGDGKLDVVAAGDNSHEVVWYKNGGESPISWTKQTIDTNLRGAEVVYVADIDGDTDLDVAATGPGAYDVVWYENGGGTPITWTKHTIDPNLGTALECCVADIDGDNDMDVVASGRTGGEVMWYENDGGNPINWIPHSIHINGIEGAFGIDVDDIDGDNNLDVAVAGYQQDNVYWCENNLPDTIWTIHSIDANLDVALTVGIAVMDQDSDLDVLATGQDADAVVWYENPTWIKHTIDANLNGANFVLAADMEGDGDLDAFVTGWNANQVIWYENPVSTASGIEPLSDKVPTGYLLLQNYPNPFNPSTIITYQLPITAEVELSIYNLLGQKVMTLVSERQVAGTYRVYWDAGGFPSGEYYYRIEAGAHRQVRKMVLIR
jgi:hypothetical protein